MLVVACLGFFISSRAKSKFSAFGRLRADCAGSSNIGDYSTRAACEIIILAALRAGENVSAKCMRLMRRAGDGKVRVIYGWQAWWLLPSCNINVDTLPSGMLVVSVCKMRRALKS